MVLHPYGRFCNANKFAGEEDLFEALEHVKQNYSIDEQRIAVRGFSMGGAACWHFAAHHAGLWRAAAPGAGFSETPDYLNLTGKLSSIPQYEQVLWHWYNATDYALNLFQCPTVAYSGGADKQIQAARMMEKAMGKVGLDLVHIIGPDTGHRYHPDSKDEIIRRVDSILESQKPPVPKSIKFATWTLHYHQMNWLEIHGLDRHWYHSEIEAELESRIGVSILSKNVNRIKLVFQSGEAPFITDHEPHIKVDRQLLIGPKVTSDRSWIVFLEKADDGLWSLVSGFHSSKLRKIPGLQGPIDDAFTGPFLFVEPTGKAMHHEVHQWVVSELADATTQWRQQFRGEAPIKTDREISDSDIADHHLVLWGDPESNLILSQIIDDLPIKWTGGMLEISGQSFDVQRHVPMLVFPNPLNPEKYIVLNTGFTFSEFGHLSNATQTPKLPDFGVVRIHVPRERRYPDGVVHAGFFNEFWQLEENGKTQLLFSPRRGQLQE
ncbi:MAG TPA: hypothetical protein EYQ50_27975 [Verrucomicrobiales bacterium]|nr:hypothetical protein [Verrucomicrobiales bacterium]